MEGNEAILTDFTLPEAPEEAEVSKNPEEDLKELLTEQQIADVKNLVEGDATGEPEPVTIDVTDYDKDKRAKLHKSLKLIYGKGITNETKNEEEKKLIIVKKANKNDKERAHGWRWPHEYTYFVMHKENVDTLQAIATLSHQLKMKPALFSYAGTKDKRAKTSQWICSKKLEPSRISQVMRKCQGIRAGNFKFHPETLRLGHLKGNHFRIALRSVKGDQDEITKSLESLRDFGFINYYGLQRFGNCQKIPTYMVGKALVCGKFEEACELIMKERVGEPQFMGKMRHVYRTTKDPKQALGCLHTSNTCIEARLLHGFDKHGSKNYLQALQNLPRNMLMLYTHAYQSFLWNQLVSKRRGLGLEVIEGDLVFTEQPKNGEIEEVIEEAPMEGEDDEAEPAEESKYCAMVRPLTKEDLEKKTYTLYDIVLPLPGYDVKYVKRCSNGARVDGFYFQVPFK